MSFSSVSVRNATLHDAELLLVWRNDAASRAASPDPLAVTVNDHLEWLKNAIESDKYVIRISEVEGKPAGLVRFQEKDYWEVSWFVAPEFRGRGLASSIISAAMEQFKHPVIACIRDSNTPSLRIAEKLGFLVESTEGNWIKLLRNGTEELYQ